LGLNTKSDEGVGWGDSPPGSGGGGDEGSNSKGEFHFEVEVVVCFLIIKSFNLASFIPGSGRLLNDNQFDQNHFFKNLIKY